MKKAIYGIIILSILLTAIPITAKEINYRQEYIRYKHRYEKYKKKYKKLKKQVEEKELVDGNDYESLYQDYLQCVRVRDGVNDSKWTNL